MKKRNSARRAATFLAALGALVMSSGVALMVTATSANADPDPKIVVCKYVGTPGESTLQGGGNPIEVSINSIKSVVGDDWVANPTFPKAWGDAQGQAGGGSIAIGYVGQGLTIANCPGGQEEPPTPPTCPQGTDRAGDEIPEGQTAEEFCDVDVVQHTLCPEGTDNAGQTVPEGSTIEEFCTDTVSPPAVSDEGTDNAGQTIPEGQTAEAFCNDSSVVVSPPKVTHHTTTEAAAAEATTTAVTPTVVHAGMGSLSQDMRGEQGLALMVAGMMMLTAAGGLGLRVRRAVSRI